MKKLLALLLALLAVLPLFVACQNSGSDTVTTAAPQDTDPAATEDPFDDKVPDTDYNQWEFLIAAPTPEEWGPKSYDREEDSGDTIESAIYTRNRQLEARFNITIKSMGLGSTDSMPGEFNTFKLSGEDKIDVLAVGFYQSGKPLIVQDSVLPWNGVEYINLERDWWNSSVTETLSILGNYYYIVGDVNWFTMPEVPVCYFNKNLATDQKDIVGDLYQTVRDMQWTFDTCYNIAKKIANDSSGDGIYDENDTYGAIQNTIIGVTGFLYATGYQTVIMTNKGPEMNFNTPKMQNIIEWLVTFCRENNTSYTEKFDFARDSKGVEIFFDDRALFYFDVLMFAEEFRDRESDFGIIPYPMYDTEQEDYVAYANQWGLACALPVTATDTSRTGAILEAMSALSRKLIVPAYYDKTLMGKIKRDDESEEMLDRIFSNILYDFGICYCTDLSYVIAETMVRNNDKNVTSWWKGRSRVIKANYEELFEHVYDSINGEGAYEEDF